MARRTIRRHGLTLAELLIAATIMLMIAAAVGTLAATVKSTNDYCQGYTASAQHARVALSRIERAVTNAFANEQFPGCLIVAEQAGSQLLPHTLVVWYSSTGAVVNSTGLPLISEIVVYGFDPAHPNHFIEVRSPTENVAVPAASDTSAWTSLTSRLKSSTTVTKTVLTDRLRTSPLTGNYSDTLSPSDLRGCVRFRRLMEPSDSEWTQYRAGTKSWQSLAWPLDSYRTTSGTRVVVCQTELQIAPASMSSAAVTAIPFYGSASIQYELAR
jgi:Tfp pilus assembly protein PilW